jgi:hypothetical protein
MQLYFQDKKSDADEWQGLILSCSDAKPLPRLQTTQNRCMKLSAAAHDLFWAKIEDDYYGVEMLRKLPTSENVQLMPHIHNADLMKMRGLSATAQQQFWAKFFVQGLQSSNLSPLYNGLWALDCRQLSYDYHGPVWLGRTQSKWSVAKEEDLIFLTANDVYIDWGACGNGNLINLFAPHQKPQEVGRVKWWLKVAREQALPPLLVWHISALDACVLLDGHDRLQAALINGIAPTCLVLSSYTETANWLDEDKQNAILRQLQMIEEKMAKGVLVSQNTIAGINTALVQVFDNRPVERHQTRALANMTSQQWDAETRAFKSVLKKRSPHVAIEQFHLRD